MSFDAFDVCASGMHAQRIKMDTISSNIANVNTTRNPDGSKGVYIKKEVSFKAVYDDKYGMPFPKGGVEPGYSQNKDTFVLKGGVVIGDEQIARGVEVAEVTESKNPYKIVFDPEHPDADENGYLTLPNINIVEEMVGMITASKAYEANASVADTIKSMMQTAMRI